jgi:hypothetical protein
VLEGFELKIPSETSCLKFESLFAYLLARGFFLEENITEGRGDKLTFTAEEIVKAA